MTEGALFWPETAESPRYGDEETLGIIRRCLKGDEIAYAALYNLYASTIYRLTYSLLQNREDAEEVLQDSFDYAFRKLSHFNPNKSAFKTWLYRITISRCRNKRRRKRLPSFPLSQITGPDAADKHAVQPDDAISLTERQKEVWEALSSLSPKLRETAVLRYYEGMTYPEIGSVLSIPTKTAESRMRLAHKALKEKLVRE